MDALEMTLLLDYYGGMLTDKQRDCFDMRHNQDLSLGEIGEALGVSRQAVCDNLTRDGKLCFAGWRRIRLCPQRQGQSGKAAQEISRRRKAGSLPRTRDGQPCRADYDRCPDTEGVSYGV